MSHDAYTDRLLDLAYGELSPRDARTVEAHAAACEACRAELRRIRETRALASGLAHVPAPPGGERILLAAARAATEARRPRRLLPAWLWGAMAAVAVVAVGAVSYRLLAIRPGPLERDDPEALLGGSYAAERAADRRMEGHEEASPPSEVAADRSEARPARKAAPAEPRRAVAPPTHADPSAGPAPRGRTAAPAAEPPASAPPPPGQRDAALAASAEPAPAPTPSGPEVAVATPQRAGASRPPPEEIRGAPTVEVRTFAGCAGETTRRVEHDARGRVVRYVREGTIGGRRLAIEHVYGEDGALARATARDLDRPTVPIDAHALDVVLVDRAEDARADAPPRCAR
jgi:hypothetical protein